MDALGLYDIYDYRYTPFWHTTAFKITTFAVILIVCIVFIYYVLRFLEKRKTLNMWEQWNTKLEALRKKPVKDSLFYVTLSSIIKECAVLKLGFKESLTDLELSLLLKSGDYVDTIKRLAEVLERAHYYKFDPRRPALAAQDKDTEYVTDALQVIKQMEQKQ